MQCWKTFFYEKVEEKDKRRLLREGVETVKANLGEQFSKKKEKNPLDIVSLLCQHNF